MQVRHLPALVITAVALAASVGASSAATPVPSPAPGYLSDDYGTVFLASNALMQGTKVVVKPVNGPANQVTAFPKPKPEPYVYVWGPSCTPAAQTVTFTRDVWLPGPPNQNAQFFYTAYRLGPFFTSLKTIDLIINGKVIVHQNVPSSAYNTVQLPDSAQKAFRPGENTYQVRVHKAATTGACNTSKTNVVGVEFGLSGHITTDLDVALNPAPAYIKIGTNETQATSFNVTVRNLGPSLVVKGTFHISVCCPHQFIAGVHEALQQKLPTKNVSGCQTTQSGSSYNLDCSIDGLEPGASASEAATFDVVGPPVDVGDFNVSISWSVVSNGVYDPNTQNNQGGTKVVFCTSKPNDPGCSGGGSAGSGVKF